jgi:hypothetical protein
MRDSIVFGKERKEREVCSSSKAWKEDFFCGLFKNIGSG